MTARCQYSRLSAPRRRGPPCRGGLRDFMRRPVCALVCPQWYSEHYGSTEAANTKGNARTAVQAASTHASRGKACGERSDQPARPAPGLVFDVHPRRGGTCGVQSIRMQQHADCVVDDRSGPGNCSGQAETAPASLYLRRANILYTGRMIARDSDPCQPLPRCPRHTGHALT